MSAALVAHVAGKRTRVGRPSAAAPFREFVYGLLEVTPGLSTREILRLTKTKGYRGGKSAMYGLVADIRRRGGFRSLAAQRAAARAEQTAAKVARRSAKAAQRERWEAERLDKKARVREQRAAKQMLDRLPREPFHPLATDEQSSYLRVLARKWLEGRNNTHKTCGDDRCRWSLHLAPAFGDLEPREIDVPKIRIFVEEKLAAGMVSTTVRNCIALLSSLFTDLVEQGVAARNPVRAVPRAVKRLWRRAHDPRTTPFLERKEDINRLRSVLAEPLRTMFSVAVKSGLRPSELVALEWGDLRSEMQVMHVQRRYRLGKVDVPKSGKGRVVPISPELAQVLEQWRRATDGRGAVFKPRGRTKYIDMGHLREVWRDGLRRAELAPISFYRATRHTFASHWVMAGQPIEKLSKILGHSSVMVTEIYAHLKPESLTVPDVISFDPRVVDPKPEGESAAEKIAAELAEARGQISRLTELLLTQLGAASKSSQREIDWAGADPKVPGAVAL